MSAGVDTNDTIYRPEGFPPRRDPAYSPEGVDLTQIRRLLALTPAERLRELEEFLADLDALRPEDGRCSSAPS
jgi:hypothetical protein